jgi:signal peptidase II
LKNNAVKQKRLYHFFLIAFGVIVLDQIIKLWVHETMYEGEFFEVITGMSWLKIHYITNPGMAFGMQIAGDYGKIFLTVFRLVAMFAIGWYMGQLYQKKSHPGLLVCIALILGGAIGNLIDSIFYGVLYDLTVNNAPTPWFHGKVIDMFYFDIAEGYYADWIPFIGGDYYDFWPIFNVADASIFCSVIIILIFQKKFFKHEEKKEKTSSAGTVDPEKEVKNPEVGPTENINAE